MKKHFRNRLGHRLQQSIGFSRYASCSEHVNGGQSVFLSHLISPPSYKINLNHLSG